jgi:sulfatase modifying factor 1
MNLDELNLVVKTVAANNEIILDRGDEPSVMVRIPMFTLDQVVDGAPATPHPAFIVAGTTVPEIWISKYQNTVINGLAQSLPASDPTGSLTYDEAIAACTAKGPGWHLITNAEWAAIALWCRKNGFFPEGNNWLGKAKTDAVYEAIPSSYDDQGRRAHILTGTGPQHWSHNNEPNGIRDLNGNVVEFVTGVRTVYGEIQIIPDNDAALPTDMGPHSPAWQAILADGTHVTPGTPGTLKYDFRHLEEREGKVSSAGLEGDGYFVISTEIVHRYEDTKFAPFNEIVAADGVAIPDELKALALAPYDAGYHGDDAVFINNGVPEKIMNRGGAQHSHTSGGVFFLSGNGVRDRRSPAIGFRSAYIPGI